MNIKENKSIVLNIVNQQTSENTKLEHNVNKYIARVRSPIFRKFAIIRPVKNCLEKYRKYTLRSAECKLESIRDKYPVLDPQRSCKDRYILWRTHRLENVLKKELTYFWSSGKFTDRMVERMSNSQLDTMMKIQYPRTKEQVEACNSIMNIEQQILLLRKEIMNTIYVLDTKGTILDNLIEFEMKKVEKNFDKAIQLRMTSIELAKENGLLSKSQIEVMGAQLQNKDIDIEKNKSAIRKSLDENVDEDMSKVVKAEEKSSIEKEDFYNEKYPKVVVECTTPKSRRVSFNRDVVVVKAK